MEAFKSFENLSEREKFRFFQLIWNSADGLSDNEDEGPEIGNSKRSNLSLFLESIKKVCGNKPENNQQVGKSKRTQKTLDSWLIRRKDGFSRRNKVEQSSSQSIVQSCEISYSDDVTEVSSHAGLIVTNDGEDASSLDGLSSDKNICIGSKNVVKNSETNNNIFKSDEQTVSSRTPEKSKLTNKQTVSSRTPEKNKLTNDQTVSSRTPEKSKLSNEQTVSSRTPEKSKLTNEKYNLRSKRKAELSPVADGDRSDIKHLKLIDSQHNIPNISDNDKIVNDPQPDVNGTGHGLTVEENVCDKYNSLEKKKCNPRTKRKNSKLLQTKNSITVQGESNSQMTNSKALMLYTTSCCQSNYESFCLLSKECSKAGLNIMDILQHEKIQTLLKNHKSLSNDAVVFIGSFETKAKKMLPVVHLAQSKAVLQKKLSELRK